MLVARMIRSKTAFLSVVVLTASTSAFVACRPAPEDPAVARLDATPVPAEMYLAGMPEQEVQRANLCARGNQDDFSNWYCAKKIAPDIHNLEDLLEGVKLKDPANPFSMQFAMNSHSTSVVGRNTSALNPRVVIFTPAVFTNAPGESPNIPGGTTTSSTNTSGFLALGFARGSHLVEIASFDHVRHDINFYLIHYTKSCDPSCPNSELFTAETESHWTSVTVYGDPDIKNTPLDCLQCHEPGGLGTKRILRMQERQFPWTHWFFPAFEGGGPTNGAASDVATTPAPAPAGQFVNAYWFDGGSELRQSRQFLAPGLATMSIQRVID